MLTFGRYGGRFVPETLIPALSELEQAWQETADDEASLVLLDGRLVAVLTQLRDESHGEHQGRWFLEAAFTDRAPHAGQTFATLEQAADWCCQSLF